MVSGTKSWRILLVCGSNPSYHCPIARVWLCSYIGVNFRGFMLEKSFNQNFFSSFFEIHSLILIIKTPSTFVILVRASLMISSGLEHRHVPRSEAVQPRVPNQISVALSLSLFALHMCAINNNGFWQCILLHCNSSLSHSLRCTYV